MGDQPWVFHEIFAGCARLTQAVADEGVPALYPQDLVTEGWDLSTRAGVEALKALWGLVLAGEAVEPGHRYFRRDVAEGTQIWENLGGVERRIVAHFGTPCASFSRARDRSARTRLRSKEHPWGFSRTCPVTELGNQLARRTAELIRFLVRRGGAATVENPADSYLWACLDALLSDVPSEDVFLTQCMFGTPWRKATRIRVFGPLNLASLGRVCGAASDFRPRFHRRAPSCGQGVHVRLGFAPRGGTVAGGAAPASTTLAAAYPRSFVRRGQSWWLAWLMHPRRTTGPSR